MRKEIRSQTAAQREISKLDSQTWEHETQYQCFIPFRVYIRVVVEVYLAT